MTGNPDTQQAPISCFVIGPIGEAGTATRKQADMFFYGVVKPALPKDTLILRADMEQSPGMITDAIIRRIYDSNVVIADLSHWNPNVFYELGIRHAAERPTIHMAAIETKVPFDNLGYRYISYDLSDWHSQERARDDLRSQFSEVIREDYKPTNPVTHALTVRAFNASPDTETKALGQVMERLERLEGSARNSRGRIVEITGFEAALSETADRRDNLSTIADTIHTKLGIKFTEEEVSDFVDNNANNEHYYNHIVKLARDGKLTEIIDDIKNHGMPF